MFIDKVKEISISPSQVYANFDLSVPVIYKEIIAINQEHNTNILKSLATIITIYDLNKYSVFEINELESRAVDYARAVREYLELFSFRSNFNDWVDFLSFLYLKSKPEEKLLSQELEQNKEQDQEQEFSGIIAESATREIVREISYEDKEIILEIVRENIKKNSRLKGRYFQLVIEKILENKKKISAKIKEQVKRNHKKENLFLRTMRFFGWNLIEGALNRYRMTNVTEKSVDASLTSLKRRSFAKSGLEYNLKTRQAKILKDIVSKKGQNTQYLYSAFHSHNPEEKIKLPTGIVNNIELKREAHRLGSTGMSKYAAAHEAENNINHRHADQVLNSKTNSKGRGA